MSSTIFFLFLIYTCHALELVVQNHSEFPSSYTYTLWDLFDVEDKIKGKIKMKRNLVCVDVAEFFIRSEICQEFLYKISLDEHQ